VANSNDPTLAYNGSAGVQGVQQAHIQLMTLDAQGGSRLVQKLNDPNDPQFDGRVNLDSIDPGDLIDANGHLFFLDRVDLPNNAGQPSTGWDVTVTQVSAVGATSLAIAPLPTRCRRAPCSPSPSITRPRTLRLSSR